MTDRPADLTAPLVQRLPGDLLESLPRHRRRQIGLGAAAPATVAVVARAVGPASPRGAERDDRGADVATTSSVSGTTATTEPRGQMPGPVTLRVRQDMGYMEIAEGLGCSKGLVDGVEARR